MRIPTSIRARYHRVQVCNFYWQGLQVKSSTLLLLYGTMSAGIVMYSIGYECPVPSAWIVIYIVIYSYTVHIYIYIYMCVALRYCQSWHWHATFHLSDQSEFEG